MGNPQRDWEEALAAWDVLEAECERNGDPPAQPAKQQKKRRRREAPAPCRWPAAAAPAAAASAPPAPAAGADDTVDDDDCVIVGEVTASQREAAARADQIELDSLPLPPAPEAAAAAADTGAGSVRIAAFLAGALPSPLEGSASTANQGALFFTSIVCKILKLSPMATGEWFH